MIRNVLGELGAGKIGNYDFCSFSYLGTGRFRGNEKSKPAIGVPGEIQEVQEEVLEIVMEEIVDQSIQLGPLTAISGRCEPNHEIVICGVV